MQKKDAICGSTKDGNVHYLSPISPIPSIKGLQYTTLCFVESGPISSVTFLYQTINTINHWAERGRRTLPQYRLIQTAHRTLPELLHLTHLLRFPSSLRCLSSVFISHSCFKDTGRTCDTAGRHTVCQYALTRYWPYLNWLWVIDSKSYHSIEVTMKARVGHAEGVSNFEVPCIFGWVGRGYCHDEFSLRDVLH